MAVGTIDTRTLTDIANAIRYQAGVATLYKPRQMAAAVAALDGSRGSGYQAQGYKELESGVVSESVFEDIADAIRGQNGSDETYTPSEMAPAILALTWGATTALRFLLCTDGTLEITYGTSEASPNGRTVSQVFVCDPAGYASAADCPWNDAREDFTSVVIDASVENAHVTSIDYWFFRCFNIVEVSGFEHLTEATTATNTFMYCSSLETIWVTAGYVSPITSGTHPFFAPYLVGGGDCHVAAYEDTVAAFTAGAGGNLTCAASDRREWADVICYDDGTCVVTLGEPDSSKTMLGRKHICTNCHYTSAGMFLGYTHRATMTSVHFDASLAGLRDPVSLDLWFYYMNNLTSVTGWSNIPSVCSMYFTFGTCTSLVTLDLGGLDPSTITSYRSTFTNCTSLVTVYVDPTWELAEGASGDGTFSNCDSLVGGNGSRVEQYNYGYRYMVIDTAETVGYLTARSAV